VRVGVPAGADSGARWFAAGGFSPLNALWPADQVASLWHVLAWFEALDGEGGAAATSPVMPLELLGMATRTRKHSEAHRLEGGGSDNGL